MEIKALLFDLDNTLIFFDEKEFFEAYSKQLYLSFQDIIKPEEFLQRLMHATQVMTENNGELNNAEFFMQDFLINLPVDAQAMWQRFEEFYAQQFIRFKKLMHPVRQTRQLFDELTSKGLKIVIASNPMFPENVQHFRLDWAGLAGFPFDRITHATNSSFCKPNLDYYREISDYIGVRPENCLMVGNDPYNDMIATKTGMKTYLTTDGVQNSTEVSREFVRNSSFEFPEPDFKGKLIDVLRVL